jgi:hypothetical protein
MHVHSSELHFQKAAQELGSIHDGKHKDIGLRMVHQMHNGAGIIASCMHAVPIFSSRSFFKSFPNSRMTAMERSLFWTCISHRYEPEHIISILHLRLLSAKQESRIRRIFASVGAVPGPGYRMLLLAGAKPWPCLLARSPIVLPMPW